MFARKGVDGEMDWKEFVRNAPDPVWVPKIRARKAVVLGKAMENEECFPSDC